MSFLTPSMPTPPPPPPPPPEPDLGRARALAEEAELEAVAVARGAAQQLLPVRLGKLSNLLTANQH